MHLNGRLNAQVESDIVGYTTIEVTKEWTLMGVNFTGLESSSTEEIPIVSLISGDFSAGDQIQIPKATTGYNLAGWNETLGKWCTYNRTGISNNEATYTIPAGKGFWLKSTAASAANPLYVQFAGKVYDGADVVVTLGQQYTIFSPLSPSAIAVNSEDLVWSNFVAGDQVQVPKKDATGYDVAGWNANLGKWCKIGRTTVTNEPVTFSITPGSSIWVVSQNADAKVSIKSPLAK